MEYKEALAQAGESMSGRWDSAGAERGLEELLEELQLALGTALGEGTSKAAPLIGDQ